jgi:hypothetical protein
VEQKNDITIKDLQNSLLEKSTKIQQNLADHKQMQMQIVEIMESAARKFKDSEVELSNVIVSKFGELEHQLGLLDNNTTKGEAEIMTELTVCAEVKHQIKAKIHALCDAIQNSIAQMAQRISDSTLVRILN